MTEALAGLRAFVLGGTRGIGGAVSAELAAAGADVAAGYAERDDAARRAHESCTRSGVTARRPLLTGAASCAESSSSVLRSEVTSRSSGSVPPTV